MTDTPVFRLSGASYKNSFSNSNEGQQVYGYDFLDVIDVIDSKGMSPFLRPKNRQSNSGSIDKEMPCHDINSVENSESHHISSSSADVSNYSNKNSFQVNNHSNSSDDEDQTPKIIKGKIQYDAAMVILEESKSHLEASAVSELSSINEVRVGKKR